MVNRTSALTHVPGFRAVGVTCGLKKSGKPDLALILNESPCRAAAVFTTNAFKAAPVLYDLDLLGRVDTLRGVVINAGNANAVTGEQGMRDAAHMARLVEAACDLPIDSVFVMSTGVIGEPMPMDKVALGVNLAAETIVSEAGLRGDDAVQAIMTTDLVPKEAFAQIELGGRPVGIGGMAKGSGMIHPNLATMLSVVVTDAALEPEPLRAALKQVVDRTFHRVTVDGDTSTNDTVLLLASGQTGHAPITKADGPEFEAFVAGLTAVCTQLAKTIARDGEGATKLVEITVRGAATEAEAAAAAKTVGTSPLMKTALFGNDPNWGRALAAIGRSGVQVNPARVSLRMGDFLLVAQGEPLPFDAEAASQWMSNTQEISLVADIGIAEAEATIWTCDFSYKYVEINAEYHT